MSLSQLLITKTIPNRNGCRIWTGTKSGKDWRAYGYLFVVGRPKRKTMGIHRFVYDKFVEKVKSDMNIDHKCRNRLCINPQHLRQVTHRENCLCGNSLWAINYKKTHCKNLHKFTDENTKYNGVYRSCKTCSTIYQREYKRKKLGFNPNNKLILKRYGHN